MSSSYVASKCMCYARTDGSICSFCQAKSKYVASKCMCYVRTDGSICSFCQTKPEYVASKCMCYVRTDGSKCTFCKAKTGYVQTNSSYVKLEETKVYSQQTSSATSRSTNCLCYIYDNGSKCMSCQETDCLLQKLTKPKESERSCLSRSENAYNPFNCVKCEKFVEFFEANRLKCGDLFHPRCLPTNKRWGETFKCHKCSKELKWGDHLAKPLRFD